MNKCCVCQKGVEYVGVLYRANAKGVPAIWVCPQHRQQTDAAPPDAEIVEITSILRNTK
jgi:hypothetical protein